MFSSPCASPTWKAPSPSTPSCSAPGRPSAVPATRTSPSPSPPLKLVLIEGAADGETRLDHLGVEVASTEEVAAAAARLRDEGLATAEENDTSCCYALQDKVWVHGPGREPWEVYVVKADAHTLTKGADGPDTCCGTTADAATDTASAGCACG